MTMVPRPARSLVVAVVVVALATVACTGDPTAVPAGQFVPDAPATTAAPGSPTPSSPRVDPVPSPVAAANPSPPAAPTSTDATAPPNADVEPTPQDVADPDDPALAEAGVDPDDVDRTDPESVARGVACGLYVSDAEVEGATGVAERLRPLVTDEVLADVTTLGFPSDPGEQREASVTGLAMPAPDTWEVSCLVVFRDATTGEPSRLPETVTVRVHLVATDGDTWRVDRLEVLV